MSKLLMVAQCSKLAQSGQVESLASADTKTLAALMVDAYFGTTDWEDGDDEAVALLEIEATMRGEYGEFLDSASGWFATESGDPAAAIFVTRFEGLPTILFVYTGKQFAGRGYATALIRNSASRLLDEGESVIALYVTDTNPARGIYEKLGFKLG
jgi:ribosomal protein S18 acetylase RimI-like enzyme